MAIPDTLWTQDEAIAFESARECLSDLMSICTSAIRKAMNEDPDSPKIERLQKARSRLASERQALRLSDRVRIDKARHTYGAMVRSFRDAGSLDVDLLLTIC